MNVCHDATKITDLAYTDFVATLEKVQNSAISVAPQFLMMELLLCKYE